jgi:hypothetical protein
VRNALNLEIPIGRRHIIEQQYRAVAAREVLFERQNLSSKS